MERYNTFKDAIPHEVNIMIISETRMCYGASFSDIIDEIRAGIVCDKLLVEAHRHDLDGPIDHDSLIQNSMWLLHHDCLLPEEKYPNFQSLLKTGLHPVGRQAVVCVDVADDEQAVRICDNIRRIYGEQIYIVISRTELVSYMLGYLSAVNPCTLAGIEYIIKWNNEVCDRLGIL